MLRVSPAADCGGAASIGKENNEYCNKKINVQNNDKKPMLLILNNAYVEP